MREDRLARALLRLYPAAWRSRYGDEFLALIAEGGLSRREVVDVVAAAGAERVRTFAALVRSDIEATDPPAGAGTVPFGDALRETALFFALVGVTVGVLAAFGLRLPNWLWWLVAAYRWGCSSYASPTTNASWSQRAQVSFFWFSAAAGLTSLGWPIAGGLARLGVPTPSDLAFYSAVGLVVLTWTVRAIYCGIRMLVYGSTWPGMHPHEIAAWRAMIVAVVILVASVDPGGETFWATAMIVCVSFRTPYDLTQAAAARRR